MKWVFRISMGFVGLIVILFIAGYVMRRNWGRDVDSVQVASGKLSFAAQRDAVGVWKVKAKDLASVSFAMGYLQALDREFQTEMLRTIANGRVAGVFGESLLAGDRLMRFNGRVAEMEEAELEKTDPDRVEFLKNYLAGRQQRIQKESTMEPLEYRIFGMERAKLPEWTPADIISLSRYQSWTLSYDFRDELMRKGLNDHFPKALADILSPAEPADSPALYGQPTIKDLPKPALMPSLKRTLGPLWAPAESEKTAVYTPAKAWQVAQDFSMLQPLSGGSNSWFVGATKEGGTSYLCNDPHLSAYWPSALYPIDYEIDNDQQFFHARGFAFPGTPLIVIGQMHRQLKAAGSKPEDLAWTITSANYVDQQDLIQIDKDDLKDAKVRKEKFVIRNPETGATQEKTFDETWTRWGPRVDEIVDTKGAKPFATPVALDWIGFRKSVGPFWFFYKRSLSPVDGIKDDLLKQFDYPNLNFTYFSRKDGIEKISHVMTGTAYARKTVAERQDQRQVMTKAQAANREISFPAQRPFLEMTLKDGQGRFFVSSNQRIFEGDLGRRVAFHESIDSRSAQIASDLEKLRENPAFAQTDHHSLQVSRFVTWAKAHIDVGRMCSGLIEAQAKECTQALAKLFDWDGNNRLESWEATVFNLWYQNFKMQFWTQSIKNIEKDRKTDDDLWFVFSFWERTNFAARFFRQIFESGEALKVHSKEFGVDFEAALLRAAKDTVAELSDQSGFHMDYWQWQYFQYINWQHPLTKIPGKLGEALARGFLTEFPPAAGAIDSPSARGATWNRDNPLNFPVQHTATMRMCIGFEPGDKEPKMRWANSTGVSGNPFSKWAWAFPHATYQKEILTE